MVGMWMEKKSQRRRYKIPDLEETVLGRGSRLKADREYYGYNENSCMSLKDMGKVFGRMCGVIGWRYW